MRSRVAIAPRAGNYGLAGSGAVVGNSGKPVECSREPYPNLTKNPLVRFPLFAFTTLTDIFPRQLL